MRTLLLLVLAVQALCFKIKIKDTLDENGGDPRGYVAPASAITGRIQLHSDTSTDFMCLARIQNKGVWTLTSQPCSYQNNQLFVYYAGGTNALPYLQSYQGNGQWLATDKGVSLSASVSKSKGNFYSWELVTTDFGPIRLRDGTDAFACLQLSDSGTSVSTSLKLLDKNAGLRSCSPFRFMEVSTDFLMGTISYESRNQQSLCVTYRPGPVAPASSLFIAPCNANNINQKFAYNYISKHLRPAGAIDPLMGINSYLDQPVFFFWWRGAIKRYYDIDLDEDGYGWNLPIFRYDSVTADDDRHYSGYCWQVTANGDITANQTCNSFAFKPTNMPFFTNGIPPMPRSFQAVTVQLLDGTKYSCLTAMTAADGSWMLGFANCDTSKFAITQRFILSLTQNNTGHLRWAGDPMNAIVLPVNFIRTLYDTMTFTQAYEDSLNFAFTFPALNKLDAIYLNGAGCWGSDTNGLRVNDARLGCRKFKLVPVTAPVAEADANGVQVVARFDYRSNEIMMNAAGQAYAGAAAMKQMVLNGTLTSDQFANFFSYFNVYRADLGVFGVRRLRLAGRATFHPYGFLDANPNPLQVGGGALSLYPFDSFGRYLAVSVWFGARPMDANVRPKRSYLLMSFAREAGCVVFVTYRGKAGFRCNLPGNTKLSALVQSWPSAGFSLLDGAAHKVSLVYSYTANDTIQLYVDGTLVLQRTVPVTSQLSSVAGSVSFFSDPYFWQYRPLPAFLLRASVTTSQSWTAITNQAQALRAAFVAALPGTDPLAETQSLTTRWENCTFSKWGPVYYDMNCTIVPLRNGVPVSISQDTLSLGCSRPGCDIRFLSAQPPGSAFPFQYLPNFPVSFYSENVGNPPRFDDPSFVTDGFRVAVVQFALLYQGDPTMLEVDQQVSVSDPRRYRCLESINPITYFIQEASDEIFPQDDVVPNTWSQNDQGDD